MVSPIIGLLWYSRRIRRHGGRPCSQGDPPDAPLHHFYRYDLGTAGLALTKRLFKTWHSFGEHQDRQRLIAEMKEIQDELRKLLEHAARKSPRTRQHRGFAKNLLKIWPAL